MSEADPANWTPRQRPEQQRDALACDLNAGSFSFDIVTYLLTELSHLRPRLASSGDRRYLRPLWVFWSRDDDQSELSLSLSSTSFSELVVRNLSDPLVIKEKIRTALTILAFRERRVLIQFWAPMTVDGRRLLATSGQPFGLGVIDEGLCFYRMESLRYKFIVDGDHDEDIGLPGRVFLQNLPEWTPDVHHYSAKDYPQRNHALRCNVQGSLALPVCEPSGQLCVGVLELVMSSEYLDSACEVQEVCYALQAVDLKSSNIANHPNFQILSEHHQHALDEIFKALEVMCDTKKLPLAQTWFVSECRSIVAYGQNLEKSCGSFDLSCVGKVCMSTASLPFYVSDARMWQFRKACTEHHLLKGHGVVGLALSTYNLCLCTDVTELKETEYPLVHFARKYGLTSSFAVCLWNIHTSNDNYIIEFFLPPSIQNLSEIHSLVESVLVTMKQHFHSFRAASGMDLVSTKFVRVSSNGKIDSEPQSTGSPQMRKTLPTIEKTLEPSSSDFQLVLEDYNVNNKQNAAIAEPSANILGSFEKKSGSASIRCPPVPKALLITEEMSEHSSSDLQLVVEDDTVNNKQNANIAEPSASILTSFQKKDDSAIIVAEKKIDSAVIYSEKKETGKIPKRKRRRTDKSISLEDIQHHFGRTIEDAADIFGVSRSTLKRICRNHGISRWPSRKREKDNGSMPKHQRTKESIQGTVGGFSTSLVSNTQSTIVDFNPRPSDQQNFELPLQDAARPPVPNPDDIVFAEHHTSPGQRLVERMVHPKSSKNLPLLVVGGHVLDSSNQYSDIPLTQAVDNVANTTPPVTAIQGAKTLTIKATYGNDIIKFPFPLSAGMRELEEKVAMRLQLKVGSFILKYLDGDGDWILISCDADLKFCLTNLSSSDVTAIKLSIQLKSN